METLQLWIDASFKVVPLLWTVHPTRRKTMGWNTSSNNGRVIVGSGAVILWKVSSLCNEAEVRSVIFFSSWVGWLKGWKKSWLPTCDPCQGKVMEVLIVPEGLEAGMAVEYRHPWVGRSREKSGKPFLYPCVGILKHRVCIWRQLWPYIVFLESSARFSKKMDPR